MYNNIYYTLIILAGLILSKTSPSSSARMPIPFHRPGVEAIKQHTRMSLAETCRLTVGLSPLDVPASSNRLAIRFGRKLLPEKKLGEWGRGFWA